MLRELAGAGAAACAPATGASTSARASTSGGGHLGLDGGAGADALNPLARLAGTVLGGGAKVAEQSGGGFRSVLPGAAASAGAVGGGEPLTARLTPWQLRSRVLADRDFEAAWQQQQRGGNAAGVTGQANDQFESAWREQRGEGAAMREDAFALEFRQQEMKQLHAPLRVYFASAFESNAAGHVTNERWIAAEEARRAFAGFAGARNEAMGVEEVARVRNRLSVMGRHVYAHVGHEAADTITNALLESMGIAPIGVASPGQPPPGARAMPLATGVDAVGISSSQWADEFNHGAAAARRASLGDASSTGQRWAEELSSLRSNSAQPPTDAWAREFDGSGASGARDWATEFEDGIRLGNAEQPSTSSQDGLRRQTAAVADVMRSSEDPKMRQSQFLEFMSKMSTGEIAIEGNGVVDSGQRGGSSWASEFSTGAGSSRPSAWAAEFVSSTPGTARGEHSAPWAEEFAGASPGAVGLPDISPDAWVEEFERLDLLNPAVVPTPGNPDGAHASSSSSGLRGRGQYQFQANNVYIGRTDALDAAEEAFRSGSLSEAVLAMEAVVQASPDNAEYWRRLGDLHAENDDDARAIVAMTTAHEVDPSNSAVLLSLGVSHTNELDRSEAIGYLVRWLRNHPRHSRLVPSNVPVGDVMAFDDVIDLFRRAAAGDASETVADADIHIVLGVLFHLSRDFESSLGAFRKAASLRPDDYSLWNKIGVTLANGSRSEEALEMYRRALSMKKNYVRAWANLGIGFANIGDFRSAAEVYVHALQMNPGAENVWGYLRMAVACAERPDLLDAVEAKDLQRLSDELPFQFSAGVPRAWGMADSSKFQP